MLEIFLKFLAITFIVSIFFYCSSNNQLQLKFLVQLFKLSIICSPKSDEQEVQIAPICEVARKDITVSGKFGRTAAILSSFLILFILKI